MTAVATQQKSSLSAELSQETLASILYEARQPFRNDLSGSFRDIQSSLTSVHQGLFPSKFDGSTISKADQTAFNSALSDGMTLPDGLHIRWASKYGENCQGRLYIEKDGIGVSVRPFSSSDYVYTYRYDEGANKNKEFAFLEAKRGALPTLERLDGYAILAKKCRESATESPAAVQVASAYLKECGIALYNLRRQIADEVATS